MYPQKPYLVRAFYQWIIDSECTPYLLTDATHDDVVVPMEYVEDGEIVLNISPMAVKNLDVSNREITFEARFSGNPMHVIVPIKAVLAIYANENGRGMVFNMEEEEDDLPPPDGDGSDGGDEGSQAPNGRPKLKLVK